MSDEHCWIGELRGLVGWFPAKFVEVLDERSKDYTSAGDDSVSAEITDLVRGTYVLDINKPLFLINTINVIAQLLLCDTICSKCLYCLIEMNSYVYMSRK